MESFNFLQARKQRQVRQLVLLNNLQRGDQNIASTLLLTLFNRLVSNLYDDKIQVKFLPSQGIQQEQLNSFNILAQSDYLEMGKSKLDYDWVWDTLFFGRGYMETLRFNTKKKIMTPHVINPLVFGYDPYFEDVQDWRYYWKWITKSEVEINRLIKNGTIDGITKSEDISSGIDEYLWNYKIIRDAAKKAIEPSADSMGGDVFQILEFYGYDDDGDKCVYWLDKDIDKVLWYEKLDLEDLEYDIMGKDEKKGSKWPIVVKEAFREPHSSVNFSVADLLEDKHRAKSVLLNLAYMAAKDRANPIYGYNPDKVRDVTQLFSRQIEQHIPMEDAEAMWPINTEDPMSAGLIQFISLLTTEANEPMGTGQTMQPNDAKGDKTATADAINQQLNDMATSLQSKIMQFGESDFWSHWFHRYAKYGPELKSKMANIVGVKGISTTEIDFKNFNTDYPPGVMVYSAKEAEYKELVLRRDFMQLYPQLSETMDKDGMRNFNKFVFFPKFLQDPSLIDIMFPESLDEMKAKDENTELAKDNHVPVAPTDNHTTHIYIHNMLQPKTWALWFHIAEHEQLLAQAQANAPQGQDENGQNKVSESMSFKDLPPDGQKQMAAQAGIKLDDQALAQMPEQGDQTQGGGSGNAGGIDVGKEKRSPTAAASSLKIEINPSDQIKKVKKG